jgi:hypothetical protein
VVNLFQAWKDLAWSGSTTVSVGADWYTPAGGSGPAYITIALQNKSTGQFVQSTPYVVLPGQENTGAHTVLKMVLVTLSGNDLDPTVHIGAY